MKDKYFPPKFKSGNFHCPNCGVYSHQEWFDVYYINSNSSYQGYSQEKNTFMCMCSYCYKISIWFEGIMVQPCMSGVPLPNVDLPEDIINDYNEARDILNRSPKGASALLRLAIQKLCKHLGQSGRNINDDIKELVKVGLPVKIQQALDIVRVVGNNAVHPGLIDLDDDNDIAMNLFTLTNMIADYMISQPKEVDILYSTLPANQIDAIKKRDNNASE